MTFGVGQAAAAAPRRRRRWTSVAESSASLIVVRSREICRRFHRLLQAPYVVLINNTEWDEVDQAPWFHSRCLPCRKKERKFKASGVLSFQARGIFGSIPKRTDLYFSPDPGIRPRCLIGSIITQVANQKHVSRCWTRNGSFTSETVAHPVPESCISGFQIQSVGSWYRLFKFLVCRRCLPTTDYNSLLDRRRDNARYLGTITRISVYESICHITTTRTRDNLRHDGRHLSGPCGCRKVGADKERGFLTYAYTRPTPAGFSLWRSSEPWAFQVLMKRSNLFALLRLHRLFLSSH